MIYDFKCDSCDFQDEFIVSLSLPKEMAVPEICPKCGKGKLEKPSEKLIALPITLFSINFFAIRFLSFYYNITGKNFHNILC